MGKTIDNLNPSLRGAAGDEAISKNPMKTLRLTFLTLAILSAATRAYCYPAEVIDISGRKYFPAVKNALSNAQNSIYLVMYFINFNPKIQNSPVTDLVEQLVNAHKRGVKVNVILDQNVSWGSKGEIRGKEAKNEIVFNYLKKQGIAVYFDHIFQVTHSKAIVIDRQTVILGSANWTESSLKNNREASCLAKSKELAEDFLSDFSEITLDYQASVLDETKVPPIRLSDAFLKDPSLAPRMVNTRDQTAFDLYLLLLRNYDGNPQGRIDIDYKSISQILGLDKKFSYVSSSDILREALTRLDQRYKLIRRQTQHPHPPYCILLNYANGQIYTPPQQGYSAIPDEYWQYGWNKRLSIAEKYFLLINLRKSAVNRNRIWSDYRQGIMEEFNIKRSSLIRGIMGLRKLNIIKVEYPAYPEEGGFLHRAPVTFKYLGLYSPEILQQEKERLSKLYGQEQFEKAIKYAQIVYKDNDIQVIEDILKKTQEYGPSAVAEAFRKVSSKAADNPKRSYRYVIGILQKEGRD